MALPSHIEDGLRGILGIPRNRIEALRQLVRELRACWALAEASGAHQGLISAAIRCAETDLARAETSALSAAATPEVQ